MAPRSREVLGANLPYGDAAEDAATQYWARGWLAFAFTEQKHAPQDAKVACIHHRTECLYRLAHRSVMSHYASLQSPRRHTRLLAFRQRMPRKAFTADEKLARLMMLLAKRGGSMAGLSGLGILL